MLAKLTAVLIAYGPAGILVLAFIDSAGIPVASGMDALVILVAAKAPSRALFAASMGVLGSLIGNLVLFLGARAGARRRAVSPPVPGGRQSPVARAVRGVHGGARIADRELGAVPGRPGRRAALR